MIYWVSQFLYGKSIDLSLISLMMILVSKTHGLSACIAARPDATHCCEGIIVLLDLSPVAIPR